MNYREKGILFCNEINKILESNDIKAAFVTGGGYAYDSVKYKSNDKSGDFDFMIVYGNENDIKKILELLKKSNFKFNTDYLELDLNLLKNNKIDIIRLSGKYQETKSTINLVPKKLINEICDFNKNMVIKKIAHNRNTSLFFSYGSDNSRIIVNFISPSFETKDGEDHYIHLDFSMIEKNNNIYLGILSDAILKGFNNNYDNIGFKELRNKFLKNIHNFFEQNNIDSTCFINLFSNNNYFPDYLKQQLLEEFNSLGVIKGKKENPKTLEPIIISSNVKIDYESNPFNFINNKPLKTDFYSYIKEMQSNEYDRQYLLDALGKFFGYLMSSKMGNEKYNDTIIDKIMVYGVNDLYIKDYSKYTIESIIEALIKDIKNNSQDLNSELIKNYLIISTKFLELITKTPISNILSKEKIDKSIFNEQIDTKMNIETLKELKNFNEIGTYHNYTSKVMGNYTEREIQFLSDTFENKNSNVLDIMCGYGRLANGLSKEGYKHIYGIDQQNYNFLGIPKDFIFIQDNFLKHIFRNKFDYAYSLYNCYDNEKDLLDNISKTHNILNDNGLLIIDFFNKTWRDSIQEDFYKELYKDDEYKLVIKRTYNKKTGDETTYYELYYKDKLINSWSFRQRFFNIDNIIDGINNRNWDISLYDSNDLSTRTNKQKHIMKLRKK